VEEEGEEIEKEEEKLATLQTSKLLTHSKVSVRCGSTGI